MKNHQKLVLEASAGSGKTYSLALRYVYLLLKGAKIGEILTLTFTNKAAQEMQERIAKFLSCLGASDLSDSQEAKADLIKSLVEDYGLKKEEIMQKAPKILEDFYTQTNRITTIDAFLNFILKKFCWYVGVPYAFEVQDLQEEEIYKEFLHSLNTQQREYFIKMCLKSQNSPLRMLEQLSRFFQDHFDCLPDQHWEVQDLQSLEQKALELAEVIKERVEGDPTSSSSALKAVVFEDIEELSDKTWIEKGSAYRFFAKLKLPQSDFDALQDALIAYHRAKDAQYLKFLQDFYTTFQKSKDRYIKSHNTLHFQEITQKNFELLCTNELDRDFFYFRLDDRISHILLDEFQDTSVVQYKLLLPLIEEVVSGSGRIEERSFFVVGDPKQSIYRFRGGFGQLMREISEQLCLQNECLDTNYRSCKQIVEFVNTLFSEVYPMDSKGVVYTPSQAIEQKEGYVKIYDVLDLKEQDSIECVKTYNAFVVEVITEMLKQGIAFEDIVILAFRNQDIAELENTLKSQQEFFGKNIITEDSLALGEKREAQIIKNALQCSLLQDKDSKEYAFYQANLCKLLGKISTEAVPILPYQGEIGKYVYQALQTYHLGGLVAQKILQVACESKDKEEFLQSLQGSQGKEKQEDQSGLRLMTIHKSKGLEFKHVIVLDRFSTPSDRGLFFCNYTLSKEGYQGEIFVKNGFRQKFDPLYIQAYQKQEEYANQEQKNLLYVAFTRAKESLRIIPVRRQRGKSAFEVLGIVQESENTFKQEWGEIPSPQNNESQGDKQPNAQEGLRLLKQKDYGRQEGFILKEYGGYKPNHIQSIKRGEAFHKGLEMYLGFEAGLQEVFAFLNNVYGFYLQSQELQKIVDSLEKTRQIFLSHFGDLDLQTEVAFMQDNRLYRMDCLLFLKDSQKSLKEIVVLDYKSGKEAQSYQEQIKHYVDYVKSQYPQVPVSGYLMYLDEDLKLERKV